MTEQTTTNHEATQNGPQAQQTAQEAPGAHNGYHGGQNGHNGQRGGYGGQRGGYNGNGGKPKPRKESNPNSLKQNNNSEVSTFDQFLKRGKREYNFHLVNNVTLAGTLVDLGQYTYTVDAKMKSGAVNRLVLQKHAVLYVNLGELPPQESAQG